MRRRVHGRYTSRQAHLRSTVGVWQSSLGVPYPSWRPSTTAQEDASPTYGSPSKTDVTTAFTPSPRSAMKLISTLTIVGPPFPGHAQGDARNADDSIDAATMQISPDDSRRQAPDPQRRSPATHGQALFDPNGIRTFGSAEVSSPLVRVRRGHPPGGQTLIVTNGTAGFNSGAARSRPSIPVTSSGHHRASNIGTAPPRPRP